MTVLKLPQTRKIIRIKPEGNSYEMDTADIELMRELSGLSRAALRTMGGTVWTATEEKQLIGDCQKVIDHALGVGAYNRMCGEVPEIKDNVVLLLGICGQIYDIARNTINDFVNQYRRDKTGVEDTKALLESIIRAGDVLSSLNLPVEEK